jgi:hypothetical protein
VVNLFDKLIAGRVLSAADFAFYVALAQLASTVFTVYLAIWQPLNVRLLQDLATDDRARALRTFCLMLLPLTALALVGVIFVAVTGGAIADLWLGSSAQADHGQVLLVLVTGFCLAGMLHAAMTLQWYSANMSGTHIGMLLGLLAVTPCLYLVLRPIDALDCATLWSAVYATAFLVSGITATRRIDKTWAVRWTRLVLLPVVVTSIVAALASGYVPQFSLAPQLVFGFGAALVVLTIYVIVVPNGVASFSFLFGLRSDTSR